MGKKNSSAPVEDHLLVSEPPSTATIIDTHAHFVLTFETYCQKYKDGKYLDAFDFFKVMYEEKNVAAVVDVWCVPPVREAWKEYADAGLDKEKWGGLEYWFVMGVHPHDSKLYTDDIEEQLLEAMQHPRCVGWGEIGLDYHYDHSPREIQRDVFTRQLRHAVRLSKSLTIHTREADDDTERILKAEVPKDHKIHIHCFTDTPELAQKLLNHFPNLYIGITGVITYSSNLNTSTVIRDMVHSSPTPFDPSSSSSSLRILLETDAPFMVPSNLHNHLPASKRKKLPLSHSAMIPWTAKFVADLINETTSSIGEVNGTNLEATSTVTTNSCEVRDDVDDLNLPPSFLWSAETVINVANENARRVYGV